jgi:hypothetical protein
MDKEKCPWCGGTDKPLRRSNLGGVLCCNEFHDKKNKEKNTIKRYDLNVYGIIVENTGFAWPTPSFYMASDVDEMLQKAIQEAKEEYYEMICPKCGTEFEHIPYDPSGKFPYPKGVLCPECQCPGNDIVGVIHPQLKLKKITQDEWDAIKKENEILTKHNSELLANIQSTNDVLDRINEHVDAIIEKGKRNEKATLSSPAYNRSAYLRKRK